MSTQLAKLRSASAVAEAIIASFTGNVAADAVETRKAELATQMEGMKPAEKIEFLINAVITAEKPKNKDGLTVETVAKAFMESPECALFTWPQIAMLVKRVLPDANTSSKSIASYASKRKEDWKIVPREKFTIDPSELLAINQ